MVVGTSSKMVFWSAVSFLFFFLLCDAFVLPQLPTTRHDPFKRILLNLAEEDQGGDAADDEIIIGGVAFPRVKKTTGSSSDEEDEDKEGDDDEDDDVIIVGGVAFPRVKTPSSTSEIENETNTSSENSIDDWAELRRKMEQDEQESSKQTQTQQESSWTVPDLEKDDDEDMEQLKADYQEYLKTFQEEQNQDTDADDSDADDEGHDSADSEEYDERMEEQRPSVFTTKPLTTAAESPSSEFEFNKRPPNYYNPNVSQPSLEEDNDTMSQPPERRQSYSSAPRRTMEIPKSTDFRANPPTSSTSFTGDGARRTFEIPRTAARSNDDPYSYRPPPGAPPSEYNSDMIAAAGLGTFSAGLLFLIQNDLGFLFSAGFGVSTVLALLSLVQEEEQKDRPQAFMLPVPLLLVTILASIGLNDQLGLGGKTIEVSTDTITTIPSISPLQGITVMAGLLVYQLPLQRLKNMIQLPYALDDLRNYLLYGVVSTVAGTGILYLVDVPLSILFGAISILSNLLLYLNVEQENRATSTLLLAVPFVTTLGIALSSSVVTVGGEGFLNVYEVFCAILSLIVFSAASTIDRMGTEALQERVVSTSKVFGGLAVLLGLYNLIVTILS